MAKKHKIVISTRKSSPALRETALGIDEGADILEDKEQGFKTRC